MMLALTRGLVLLLLLGQNGKYFSQAKRVRDVSKYDNNDNNLQETVFATDNHTRQLRSSIGVQTVLVVLVSSTAGEKDSTLNATYLQGTVFGTGLYAQSANLISQYRSCSHGMLQLKPANTGTNVKNGVLELRVYGNIAGGNIEGALQTTILNAAKASLQISDIRAAANHIMFCLPSGSLSGGSANWVSFSRTGGSISWYQNGACAMLSPMMHENGHNLGFYHSGLGTDAYGDKSGYMGYAYHQTGAPQMCFNAHKNWVSGWFDNRKMTVNPLASGAWGGNLTAFVDYSATAFNALHVINVGDFYLHLNSAKKFNKGTQASRNQVTIVKANSSHDISWFVAGLSAGQSYTYPGYKNSGGIIIQVCNVQFGSIDYAQVSIYLNSQMSKCGHM